MRPGWNWHSADSKRGKVGAGVSVGGAVPVMVGIMVAVGDVSGVRVCVAVGAKVGAGVQPARARIIPIKAKVRFAALIRFPLN